jgi:hypothetical protein
MNFPLILAILLVVATNQFTESDATPAPAAAPSGGPTPSGAPGAASGSSAADAGTSAKDPDTTTPKPTRSGTVDLKPLGSLCLILALIITIVNQF